MEAVHNTNSNYATGLCHDVVFVIDRRRIKGIGHRKQTKIISKKLVPRN
jgi:hypothetical protein